MVERTHPSFSVGTRKVGHDHPTYFIADIAANHDGDLGRCVDLINLAAEAGADAVKFQHFQAAKIVSDRGFKDLSDRLSHQATWRKSVYEVYEDASLNRDWTAVIRDAAVAAGTHFFSAPYDIAAIELLETVGVPAYKVGSGDITWLEIIAAMRDTGKPVFLATGAAAIDDVQRAMQVLEGHDGVCIMQCNTNYTGSDGNFAHIHLNVLRTYARMFPQAVLGLSDHTPGYATVLGAVALGARAIEKHFTDDVTREGPDHGFSVDPRTWRDMVDRTRELESALGSADKFVCGNEQDTVVLQRRSLRATRDLKAGSVIAPADIEPLRPAPLDGVPPYQADQLIGRRLMSDVPMGRHLRLADVD